ncbi:MAG TPA: MoaD/ThiS family protein [Desulfohalobiaceae bacterium]|nr:MoaD/ThiS family protein [Desulfohalobiaceae bacterium]
MSIKIHIPHLMQSLTDNQEFLETSKENKNVGACLKECISRYPQLKPKLFNKKGKLHNYIEIYINQESAYPDELAKPVKDGDLIYITVMLAGG